LRKTDSRPEKVIPGEKPHPAAPAITAKKKRLLPFRKNPLQFQSDLQISGMHEVSSGKDTAGKGKARKKRIHTPESHEGIIAKRGLGGQDWRVPAL